MGQTYFFAPKIFPDMRLQKVFVYGTLLKPRIQKQLFGCQPEIVAPAKLKGWVLIEHKENPAIIPSESMTVEGMVIHLTEEQLKIADEYEEIPQVYQRERVTVRTADGDFYNVWAYTRRNPLS